MPKLDQLLQSAAYTADCSTAVFFQESEPAFEVMAHFGHGVDSALVLDRDAILSLFHDDYDAVLTVSDVDTVPALRALLAKAADQIAPIRFVALAPVRDDKKKLLGLLFVGGEQPRAGLTPAQSYVLQTHAVQIAAMLDMDMIERSLTGSSKLLTESVAERLRLLESVVVHAKDAILITEAEPIDLPGPRIVYCNPAFTDVTGYTEDDVIGRTPRLLQNHNSDRNTLDRLRLALSNWQPIEVELINSKKDGTEFRVELSIVPVCNETGWYTHWVSVQRDVTERKRAEEAAAQARIAETERFYLKAMLEEQTRVQQELIYTSTHDDLTKLRNRAFFLDQLNILLRQPKAQQRSVSAVLFLDLDRFKLINDSLGHHAGDMLLTMVARRLESCLRKVDTLARIGGDEFVILIDDAGNMEVIADLARRICSVLKTPFHIEKQDMLTMCSIGIVRIDDSYESPQQVIRDADIAMYAAKKYRSGSYMFFTPSMHVEANTAFLLQMDLQYAMVRNEFYLTYQMICDTQTKTICGMEALLRWQHPTRGLVSPTEFIPVAEDIGVIEEIGWWVLSNACEQLEHWHASFPHAELRMSVNVSAIQLQSCDLLKKVENLLKAHSFRPHQLQLEITENVFIQNSERTSDVLARLRQLGIRIALDDFGTGFSSLAYIDKYQIDAIKIDRSFVSRMQTQPRTMAIVECILLLGRQIGLDIVAEGVEDEDQLRVLQSVKCPYVQGFLLAEPIHPVAVAQTLRQHFGSSMQPVDATSD